MSSERDESAVDTRIRRATSDDGIETAQMWMRSRKASQPDLPPSVHDSDDILRWIQDVVIPSKEAWVAQEAPDSIIGLMVLDEQWLDQLYVDPSRTGRGLGSRFVGLAKQLRPDLIELWTFQSNVKARTFYRRHGFWEMEFTDGTSNEEHAPDVRLRWSRNTAINA
jgi:GNAT superfamily N-acetyltransferase